jgi:aspartate kinase
MIVMKFGGSSVKDGAMIEKVIEIIASRLDRNPLVVLSAMGDTTDLLQQSAEEARLGNESDALNILEEDIADLHIETIEHLMTEEKNKENLKSNIRNHVEEIGTLLKGLAILGELTSRSLDAVLSHGEQMSTRILATAIAERDFEVEWFDAREIIQTDQRFSEATPILQETELRAKNRILPRLKSGAICITQGFVGSTESGLTTTLGRGGSDYSAAILGSVINVEEIEIWTDVDGVLTADPRIVSDAHTIAKLSYEEAAELSYFGAKVLHSKTVRPAVEKGIPLRILNTYNPGSVGTLIDRRGEENGRTIKAITCVRKLSQINVEGRGMLGVPGVAGRVFSTVADEQINVLMISQSSSEQSICFVVEHESAGRAVEALNENFERELRRRNIERIHAENGIVIITAVGMKVRDTPGVFARIFGALGANGINVRSIAQGSSDHNLSIVVLDDDAEEAIRHIHREFGLEKP